jgi:4-hydroxybenzoate polyprenyltransferase
LLDLATPFTACLLQLGRIPDPATIALGFIAAFGGYTAVYALNDVVDYRVDREDFERGGPSGSGRDLDAVFVRHPMALGLLSFREVVLWAAGWALAAFAAAYILNPVCALIFLLGALFESIYCLLLRVSSLRVLVSGVVKTLGGMAAVFAVERNPSPLFLGVLFLWLFFWEIGGQNVPNDWSDLEEDSRLRAETIPVRYGPGRASAIILASLASSVLLSTMLFRFMPVRFKPPLIVGALLAGAYFLLRPAAALHRTKSRAEASALFNRASLYPLAIFALALAAIMIRGLTGEG